MQYSKICEHHTKALTESNTTKQLQQDTLTLRMVSFPDCIFCTQVWSTGLLNFHLSALEWWCTDLKLGMIEDCIPHDQLPHIDYISKGAQIGCLRVCYLLEHFWIHSPNITLTIFEPKWHRQCTRLFSVGQKAVCEGAYTQEAGGPQKLLSDHIGCYSVHCQRWFIHYGMNDQCKTMSQWLLFGKNQVVWN